MQHQTAPGYPQNALRNRQERKQTVHANWELDAPWLRQVAKPQHHQVKTCRVRVIEFFHDRRVHLFFIVLLVIDVLLVFAELMLEAEKDCHIEKANPGNSCVASADSHGTQAPPTSTHSKRPRIFGTQSGGDEGSESDKYCTDVEFKKELPHNIHWLHTALFWASISILVIFLIELLLLMGALGKEFFRHFLYVMDFFIVAISLGLDLAVKSTAPGVLIFLRIWRFSRIFHGLSTAVQERAEMMEFENLPVMTNEMLETRQSEEERLKESREALRLMAVARSRIYQHFGSALRSELDVSDSMDKSSLSPAAVKFDPYNQFGEVGSPSTNVPTPSPAASQPMPPIPPLNLQGVNNDALFNSHM